MPKQNQTTQLEASAKSAARRAQYAAQKAEADARAAAWTKIANSYKGGVPTRTSESWSKAEGFRFTPQSERTNLQTARDRAYQAYKNNPIARTLVKTEGANVIGDGLNFHPNSQSPDWNDEAVDRYYKWLDTCSVRGSDHHPGCGLERMLFERSRVAGDIGWIQVARGLDSYIQPIQSHKIVTPDGKWSDPNIVDGIRFDAQGRPIEYYVLTQEELGVRRSFEAIPYRDFRFLMHNDDLDAARGETCFNTIFDLLAHLDRYVDGVSLAAWMATVIGIIFKQNNAAKQFGALGTLTNSAGDQQRGLIFENGMFKMIGTEEEIVQVQAHQPMQQTPDFITAILRLIGQPFDMPLEVLGKDMSHCNFASARIGLLQFYRSCRQKAARFAAPWGKTIFWWLSREQKRVDGDSKKWTTPFPEDYGNFDLIVNAWDYTDPVSEAQADLLEMTMLTKSPQMVIQERGRNAQMILKQWQEWMTKTEGLPQVQSTMTRDPAPEPTAAPEPADAGGNGNGDYANNRTR